MTPIAATGVPPPWASVRSAATGAVKASPSTWTSRTVTLSVAPGVSSSAPATGVTKAAWAASTARIVNVDSVVPPSLTSTSPACRAAKAPAANA